MTGRGRRKYVIENEDEKIEIQIIRSKRKTLGLEVKYDGTVTARVPMRASKRIIEKFIQEQEEWITRKQRGSYAVDPKKVLPAVETREGKEKKKAPEEIIWKVQGSSRGKRGSDRRSR